MAKTNGFIPPDPEKENLWTIHVNIGQTGKHHVRIDPPREHRVCVFPPDDEVRDEIERRLSDGEDLMDILHDPDGNISF